MGIVLADVLTQIEHIAKNAKSVATGMEELIDFCEEQMPHKGWSKFRGLDYEGDTEHLLRFFVDLFKDKPPSAKIDGLYFCLFKMNELEEESPFDLGVYGMPGLIEANGEWDEEEIYTVEDAEARSRVLAEICTRATKRGGVGLQATASLAMGYAAMVILELCQEEPDLLLCGGAKQRAIVVGFDEGDCLLLGSISESGFAPVRKSQRKREEKIQVKGFSLVAALTSVSGRRILDEMAIKDYDGNPISPTAFMDAKELDLTLPLQMGIIRNGRPADFEFIGGCVVPVVSEKVADLIKDMAGDCVQLLPVQIDGSIGERYIINPLQCAQTKVLQRKDEDPHLDESKFPQSHVFASLISMDEFGGYTTFRITFSDALREQLAALDITGISFEDVPDGTSGFVLN